MLIKKALLIILVLSTFKTYAKENMVLTNEETRPVATGFEKYFTGKAKVSLLFSPIKDSTSLSVSSVTFDPSARSNWHTHPKGQLIIVTDGNGYIQEAGEVRKDIKKGDVIWTPAGIKHWHGANSTSSLTQTVVLEFKDDKNVQWLEKVTDAEYSNIK